MAVKSSNFDEFDKNGWRWASKFARRFIIIPKSGKSGNRCKKNGFLTLEEKANLLTFATRPNTKLFTPNTAMKISEGYKKFSEDWKAWFQEKGVGSSQNRGQRNSVEHILFGSTPDPVQFLTKL